MVVEIPPACRKLGEAAKEAGLALWTVGGIVRNAILGLPESDCDLCGPQQPERLAEELGAREGIRVTDAVNGLGTAIIRAGGEKFEYTAFRKDSYADGGRHRPRDVVFTKDMGEDARRRDFTVNALYADPLTGQAFDPLGRGFSDLEQKTLRQVRPDTMQEDALRILRLVRFCAQLGFEADDETFEAAKKNAAHLANISAERIRDEFFLILMADTAYGKTGAHARGLLMLKELGVLRYIIPQLEEGAGFKQSPKFHRYDVLDHQIAVCALSPPDLTVRLAAILHDIAKPEAWRTDGNMYRHAEIGKKRARKALRDLRAPEQMVKDVSDLVAGHMFDLNNTAKDSTVRRRIMRTGEAQFERLIALREADFLGSGMNHPAKSAVKWRRVLKSMKDNDSPFSVRDLALNGQDLMRELNLAPGPEIGRILNRLLTYAVESPSRNTYVCLLKYAKMLKEGMSHVPGRRPGGR